MRILVILLLFLSIFLTGCNNPQSSPEKEGTTFRFITEYKHIYNADSLLQTTFATEYMIAGTHKQWNSAFQTIYSYQEQQLISKEELDIDHSGNPLSSYITSYQPGREEEVHMNGVDTLRYYLREYDAEDRLIHEIKYHRFSVAEFNLNIDDNYEEWLTYDTDGLITKEIFFNYSRDTKKEIHRFYDETPTASSDVNIEFVHYLEEQKGDSLINYTYFNGQLESVFIEIIKGNSTQEFTFDAENTLLFSQETLINGDERIEIDHSSEFNTVDSTYYKKDKPVRQVTITPEMKTIEVIRYDNYGNPVLVERILTVYDEDK